MGLTGMTVAVSVFVLKVHHRSPKKRPPRWLRILIHDVFGRLVCDAIRSRDHFSHSGNRAKVAEMNRKPPPKSSLSGLLEQNGFTASTNEQKSTGVDTDTSVNKKPEVELLERIAAGLGIMTEHLNTIKLDTFGCDEWKDIAKVLDKLFFWLSIVFNVMISIVSLIVFPAIAPEPV